MKALAAVPELPPVEPSELPDPERLFDLKWKAARLNISVSHLRRLVAAGVVPVIDLTIPGAKRRVLRFKP